MKFREWIHRMYSKFGNSGTFVRAKCVDRPDLGGTLITMDLEIDQDPELTELFEPEEGKEPDDCQS